jgi:hypothetical protein
MPPSCAYQTAKGEAAATAAAPSPIAGEANSRRPSRAIIGTVRVPATAEGRRSHQADSPPSRIDSQASQ